VTSILDVLSQGQGCRAMDEIGPAFEQADVAHVTPRCETGRLQGSSSDTSPCLSPLDEREGSSAQSSLRHTEPAKWSGSPAARFAIRGRLKARAP